MSYPRFSMRQLPKAEYRILRYYKDYFNVSDDTELIAVALRLLHEVSIYRDGEGEQWIVNVIDHYRSTSDTERQSAIEHALSP